MSARIVGITQPKVEGITSSEEFIAYCARVSNPANQVNNSTAGKLIKYLMKNAHWSPLEMVSITMEVKTTRDIARQLLRHRSFSFQEFSQRYAEVEEPMVCRSARLQDEKNRQNSVALNMQDEYEAGLSDRWYQMQDRVLREVQIAYEWAINNGIAKEQARAVLPEGMTPSTLYVAGTFRSWYHYCQLRMGNGTQKEHMDLATECWVELSKEFPNIEMLHDVL